MDNAQLIAFMQEKHRQLMNRIMLAFEHAKVMRSTGVLVIEGGIASERESTAGEKRSTAAAHELLANYFNGEISTDNVDDEDLPGPNLATLPGPIVPAPSTAPVPVMQSCGELFTTR